MKFSSTCIAAAAAILPELVAAHMRITDPAPYNGENNAPLNADGSNFPCMMQGGSYPQLSGPMKTYTAGQSGNFKITGGATHGGGSCQVSITYDNPPTKNSKFKVLKSWVGDCPVPSNNNNLSNDRNDNSIAPFNIEIPEGMKSGDAVFVWTWFNRIGNREMYMNCAPIKIQGGSNSDSFYNSLPDMFRANIGSEGMCTTHEGQDIIFPDENIGTNVVSGGSTCNFKPACEGQGSYSFKPGQSGGVPPPSGSSRSGDDNQSSGDGQNAGTPPAPSGPALVDTGKNPQVTNQPPSDTFNPINGGDNSSNAPTPTPPSMPTPPSTGDDNSGDDDNSNSGNTGSPTPPSTGGNGNGTQAPPTADDNTGRLFGAQCGDGKKPIVCNGAPAGSFIECYGPNMGWTHQIPAGFNGCEDFASKCGFGGSPRQKFRRHAFEHAKRFARRHTHRF